MQKRNTTITAQARALKLLSRKEYSVYELTQKLRSFHPYQEVEDAVTYCIENNWVSDTRVAECYLRTRYFAGYGLKRIVLELQQKRVAESEIQHAILESHLDWQESVDRWYLRLKTFDVESVRKFQMMLLRKGFSALEIKRGYQKRKEQEIADN